MDLSNHVLFSAFVQVAIAFDFGLLYLYKNNRSIFKGVQLRVCDSFRYNYFIGLLLSYSVNNKKVASGFMKKWNAVLATMKTKVKTAFDYEQTCDYLAVLGIVSGIYSFGWLLWIPWANNRSLNFPDLYMTLTMCTVVADCIMFLKAIFMKKMTRSKAFIQSTLVLLISCIGGYSLYKNGIAVISPMKFDNFFLVSMMVVYAPMVVYVGHILASIGLRLLTLLCLLVFATAYKLVALFC